MPKMVDFPQLPRLKRQSVKERESGDREIWQPTYKCFCCHDYGYVQPSLVRLIIPDYNPDKDLIPLCQRCEASDRWQHPDVIPSFDMRFTEEICDRLHEYDRANWRKWAKKRQKNDKVIDYSAAVKSLRKRSRSSEEEYLAQRKHAEERSK